MYVVKQESSREPRPRQVREATIRPGLVCDGADEPRPEPAHPFAAQSWAVKEIRTGRVRVTWHNGGEPEASA
jgi:hypothetical protein